MLDDGRKQSPVGGVKAEFVDLKQMQSLASTY